MKSIKQTVKRLGNRKVEISISHNLVKPSKNHSEWPTRVDFENAMINLGYTFDHSTGVFYKKKKYEEFIK